MGEGLSYLILDLVTGNCLLSEWVLVVDGLDQFIGVYFDLFDLDL